MAKKKVVTPEGFEEEIEDESEVVKETAANPTNEQDKKAIEDRKQIVREQMVQNQYLDKKDQHEISKEDQDLLRSQ